MLGIIWRIGDIAKIIKNKQGFNELSWFGGPSWHHFPLFFGCLFQDRFLIVLGSVLGSILEPFGLPNGVYVEGFGGSGLGSILGWFLGGSGTPLNFHIQLNRTPNTRWRGPR